MRLHLSTAFIVMITAAILVGLNIRGQDGVDPAHREKVSGEHPTVGWPWPYSRTYTVTTVAWTFRGMVSTTKVVTSDDASAVVADILFGFALLINLGGVCERVARGLKLQA